jgi:hypothetical protein
MRSRLARAYADGSTRRKVDRAIRAGWRPGLPASAFYKRSKKRVNVPRGTFDKQNRGVE